MMYADDCDQLTRNNVAAWDAAVIDMMAMRKGPVAPLPLLYEDLMRIAGGPVLLLCSGLGVRAIQFARAGFAVTCIDLSEAMTAHTRHLLTMEEPAVRRFVEVRRADVRTPAGHDQFGLILLEDWDFAQLLTQDDQLACLAAMREALKPDGLAVIDVFSPYYKMIRDQALTGEPVVFDTMSPDDGLLNRRITKSEFDHLTQIETMHVLFEVYQDDRKITTQSSIWKLRHTGLWEFELLLKVSGFCPILRCPDFAFDRPLSEQPPFDHATDDFAFILAKAKSS
jgi:SAM-dependent methyltransferase